MRWFGKLYIYLIGPAYFVVDPFFIRIRHNLARLRSQTQWAFFPRQCIFKIFLPLFVFILMYLRFILICGDLFFRTGFCCPKIFTCEVTYRVFTDLRRHFLRRRNCWCVGTLRTRKLPSSVSFVSRLRQRLIGQLEGKVLGAVISKDTAD